MPSLVVELTTDQYDRFKTAMKKLHEMEDEPTDEQLVAQLKREAAAVTYAAEVAGGGNQNWQF